MPDIKTHDQLLREAKGKGRGKGKGASEEKIRKTLDPTLIASLNGLSKPKEADQGHQLDSPKGQSNQTAQPDSPIGQSNWTDQVDTQTDQVHTQTDQLDRPSGHPDSPTRLSNWTDQLDTPNGQTNWTHQKDRPTGQSNWTDQMDTPTGQSEQTGQPDRPIGQTNWTGRPDRPTGHTKAELSGIKNTLAPRQLKGTNNQKTLCRYLYEQGDHISSYSLIQQGTGLPFGTIRGILRRLEEYNIIAKETWRGQDCRQGLLIRILDPERLSQTGQPDRPTRQTNQTGQLNRSTEQTNQTVQLDSPTRQTNQTGQPDRPTRQTNQTVQLDRPTGQSNWTDNPPLLVSKKENLLTKKGGTEKKETFGESSWAIGDETIAIAWPYLAAAGWRQHQLDQLQKIFTVKGIDFTVAQQAMNYAEWQLLNGGINDREGKPVTDPVAWLFKALSTFGYYKRPEGYISPEEQLAKDRAEEAKRIELLEKEAEQAEKKFDRAKALAWFDALSPEAQEEILSAQPGGKPIRNEPWIVRAWNNKGKPTKN